MQSRNLRVGAGRIFALLSLNFESGAKLALWFFISLALSLIFFQEFWASLGKMLSPDWIFGQQHAAPWGVLALCFIWLWLKRKELRQEMKQRVSLIFIIPGVALIMGAIVMPSSLEFLVFQRFAELPYSMSAIKPLVWVLTSLGYVFETEGQWIHFTSFTGEPISVSITSACAGPVTMGVFLAIFALMMLDIPLRPGKAGYMFLFGVVGTWLQSIIRLIIIMLVAYHFGEDAMWTTHSWSIYILFPLWYLFYAYVYFRQVGRGHRIKAGT